MEKDDAFVVVSNQGVAKARLADGEIHVIPLYMHNGDGTATLTYSDGSIYKLKTLTYKEAFSPPTQPPQFGIRDGGEK